MKRIQEKVKDIVDVRAYQSLSDFTTDDAQTIANYHFTDFTSELMAKWLDRIAIGAVNPKNTYALAGYRGVGKSHFLATFGAILSNPELRAKIYDSYVVSGVERLMRRHYPVAKVKRGLRDTLLDEIREAVKNVLPPDVGQVGGNITEIVEQISAIYRETPFTFLIDTAFERRERVARDDGAILGELAEKVAGKNIFVFVALDDDISDADGRNSAISKKYLIDYLDQEHLYKIVNTHIFPKRTQHLQILHDVYQYFREVIPEFKWSEQRFSSLYPLHPVILDTAPYVRLFVYDFALLGFASDAGARIQGRPANSLIAIDEVFDNVENTLRKVDLLQDAFAVYDTLNSDVVGKIPILQRLQAKLILKALLIMSLDGEGCSAAEIAAATMIFDEDAPQKAVDGVESIIQTFIDAKPDEMSVNTSGSIVKYGFKIGGNEDFTKALKEAGNRISPDEVTKKLCEMFQTSYDDCNFDEAATDGLKTDINVDWRGATRRGRLFWKESGRADSEFFDWAVLVEMPGAGTASGINIGGLPTVLWKPAIPTEDEVLTIRRHCAINSDESLTQEYGDQLRAAAHSHNIALEKIAKRLFADESVLVIDGLDYHLSEKARVSKSLSELLSESLEPLFETRYPKHPVFTSQLGMKEVDSLVADYFSGERAQQSEVQKLVEIYCKPLDIVKEQNGSLIAEPAAALAALPVVSEIMKLLSQAGSSGVLLLDIYRELKKSPLGLVKEIQHILLAAMVAQQQIEFVTSTGDRIGRRSLDLRINWDDIIGIAKPVDAVFSSEKLNHWAALITEDKTIGSIDNEVDRKNINEALAKWYTKWGDDRTLIRFGELPDEVLNTKIWRYAKTADKTFGAVAEIISGVINGERDLEEALNRIAETFSDSESDLRSAKAQLTVIENFIDGVELRTHIKSYLSASEATDDADIEQFREELFDRLDKSYFEPSKVNNLALKEAWNKFHQAFIEYFVSNHEIVMHSQYLQEKYNEILRSDKWWEFENLAQIDIFDNAYLIECKRLQRQFRQLNCGYDARAMLQTRPFCSCDFSLSKLQHWEKLPQLMWNLIGNGLNSYRETLAEQKATIIPMMESYAKTAGDQDFSAAALQIAEMLKSGKPMGKFTNEQIKVLRLVIDGVDNEDGINRFASSSLAVEEELLSLNVWENEISDSEFSL